MICVDESMNLITEDINLYWTRRTWTGRGSSVLVLCQQEPLEREDVGQRSQRRRRPQRSPLGHERQSLSSDAAAGEGKER